MRERDTVRFELAGKLRLGVVIEVQGDRVRVAYGPRKTTPRPASWSAKTPGRDARFRCESRRGSTAHIPAGSARVTWNAVRSPAHGTY